MRAAIIKKYFNCEDWETDPLFYRSSGDLQHIATYTGLNFNEIEQLPLVKYLLYKRDAWISTQMQSEQGREFLKDLRDLQQKAPDYTALRKVVRHEI